jgi:hypothetical protein
MVLEVGKFKIKGPQLVRAFSIRHSMAEGKRVRRGRGGRETEDERSDS